MSESNDGFADYLLGLVYQEGAGVPKDLQMAKNYFIKSLDKGFSAAGDQIFKVEQNIEQIGRNHETQLSKSRTVNENSRSHFEEGSKLLSSTGRVLGEVLVVAAKVALITAVLALGSYANAQASRQYNYPTQNSSSLSTSYNTTQSRSANFSNLSSSAHKERGCSSDFSCGAGERCAKAPLQSVGVCMKTVSEFGVQTYESHETNSVGTNMNLDGQCSFNTDCPTGFKCNTKLKYCVKK